MPDLRWQDQAACLGEDTERAFQIQKALIGQFIADNCDRCPVREQCLAFGAEERYGIWGGVYRNNPHSKTRGFHEYIDITRTLRPVQPNMNCGHPMDRSRPRKDNGSMRCSECDRLRAKRRREEQRREEAA